LEECCEEEGQLAEASKEGLGSEWAVVPMKMMMMMMMMMMMNASVFSVLQRPLFKKGKRRCVNCLYPQT
jgi:hypothetical protein